MSRVMPRLIAPAEQVGSVSIVLMATGFRIGQDKTVVAVRKTWKDLRIAIHMIHC
jgi:hypothetical protein